MVDRAFDIHDARLQGRALAFHGPGGLRAAGLHEPRGMEGWLRGFSGGLVMTGGLDHTLAPAVDDAGRFAYPGRAEEVFPLHGRVTGEPATLRSYGTADDLIWAEGEVRQAMLFGENLSLLRRIEVDVGGTAIRLTDRLRNLGAAESPAPILYHCNLGWPLVAPGGRIHVRGEARACGDFDPSGWDHIAEPREGSEEEVMEITVSSAGGWASALVADAAGTLALRQDWDASALPYLLIWRQFAPGTFVLGMEPSNVPALSRAAMRERGLMPVLAPGEVRITGLTLTAFSGDGARAAVRDLEDAS